MQGKFKDTIKGMAGVGFELGQFRLLSRCFQTFNHAPNIASSAQDGAFAQSYLFTSNKQTTLCQ